MQYNPIENASDPRKTRERPAKDPRKWTHPCPPYKTTPKIRDFSGTPEGREPIPQAIYRGGNAAGERGRRRRCFIFNLFIYE